MSDSPILLLLLVLLALVVFAVGAALITGTAVGATGDPFVKTQRMILK